MTDRIIKIDVEKVVKHWISTSDDDYKTMLSLYKSKSYGWSLFIGHISVEKLLKAYYVNKYKAHAPFTHNLYRLAEICEIDLTDEYSDWLDKITSFNLNATYDDYKNEFHTLCTADYSKNWIEKIKTLRLWIKKML